VVFITSSYGLGETVVQGAVNPDEFYVHKPMLKAGKKAVIRRNLGSKLIQMVFATPEEKAATGKLVKTIDVPAEQRNRYSLTDADVEQLAHYALVIEQHYGRPMDIEWGKDGTDGQLYILQARPETVKSQAKGQAELRYKLKGHGPVLAEGRAIGQKIGTGPVRLVHNISEMDKVQPGDVLVTDMTDPNWEPVMKRASAIVTNRGGRTCHAAIIARELGIPAVVGCGDATERLKDGTLVTVSCAEGDTGKIYDGLLETEVTEVQRGEMPPIKTKIMMNVGNPQLAFDFAQLPNEGVGLARLEFIINNNIGVHPKAILDYPADRCRPEEGRGIRGPWPCLAPRFLCGQGGRRRGHHCRRLLAQARHRAPVGLQEQRIPQAHRRQPLRARGRKPDAGLPRCGALHQRRLRRSLCDGMRSAQARAQRHGPDQRAGDGALCAHAGPGRARDQAAGQHGLERGKDDLKVIMMCEVPSNAILAERFLEFFDGFSIGSNDLTQLTLGLDRDSGLELLAQDFDERDPAVEALIHQAIKACLARASTSASAARAPATTLTLHSGWRRRASLRFR
jgi:pyruvate,water dikinase